MTKEQKRQYNLVYNRTNRKRKNLSEERRLQIQKKLTKDYYDLAANVIAHCLVEVICE